LPPPLVLHRRFTAASPPRPSAGSFT
jgi:hypothetical protein